MKKFVYLYGYPVKHSKSPEMHNAAYKALKLPNKFEYLRKAVPPAELGQAIQQLRSKDTAGANITIPHKENVMKYLDDISLTARAIGAVNTVINHNGILYGENTDARGYLTALSKENRFRAKGKTVAIFGAGGAAKAIVFILETAGAREISIGEVDLTKGSKLAKESHLAKAYLATSPEFLRKIAKADLVINATPLGMLGQEKKTPLTDLSVINAKQLYSDIVYNPRETLFLKNALKKGAKISYGWGMLLYQGVFALELFTGKKIKKTTIDIMRKVLLKASS